MLATIIQWFQAPAFPEDEDKTRIAKSLNIILLVVTTGALVYIPVAPFIDPKPLQAIAINLGLAMIYISLLILIRRSHVRQAAIIFSALVWLGVTLSVTAYGGILGPGLLSYFGVIAVVGLFLGGRAALIFSGISILATIGFAYSEQAGLFPKPIFPTSPIIMGWIAAFNFILTGIASYLALQNMTSALTRIRHELNERMLAKEREINRRIMMEKVIQIGKSVTAQNSDLRATLFKIRESVRNSLDFDRTAIFLHDPTDNSVQGTYGTDRSGNMSEEWNLRFKPREDGFLQRVLEQPDGFYYTPDYENELNIASIPGHAMSGVKHYAAVAVWASNKPIGVIVVDQLVSGRIISDEQLEALRLFAGYAGLAIDNAHLNVELAGRMQERENFINELGKRNAELERFTYTVSHDLRSPLVTIKGFLGMLKKDLAENHQDHITSDMQRIAGATDKMDTLLSDLLELSRIGRIVNPPEEIDLVKLAYTTLETIDGRLRAKNVTTQISPDLPTLYGDRVRLGEVLENLMDNAAKYMGEQINPHIEIGHRNDNGEQVIYVRDNGMGIEPQYLQRVFDLFEKLNPTSEGTGIGLALIKRIVEVHGGRIWVESEGLGKGSIFCFVIPDGRNSKN